MDRIWLFRGAAFLSAFLLFLVEPMAAKALLPSFGGSFLVWGACMVFFQGMLLLGYACAHALLKRFGIVRSAGIHPWILLLPFLFCPFDFGAAWGSSPLPPAIDVFFILCRRIGVPFAVLSTTSPILQAWLGASPLRERGDAHVLYGASALGSMLGILAFPTLLEPFLGLASQGSLWWGGYALLVLLQWACRSSVERGPSLGRDDRPTRPTPSAIGEWFVRSAAGCALLLAVTNVLTLDLAPVPLLWALPLAAYLLSFVVTFQRRLWFPPAMRRLLPWVLIVGLLLHLLGPIHLALPLGAGIPLHLFILFVACLNLNEGLVRSRPRAASSWSWFYLTTALGGLAGSVLVDWVAPRVGTSLLEYPASLALVAFACALGDPHRLPRRRGERGRDLLLGTASGVTLVVLSLTLLPQWAGRFLGTGEGPMPLLWVAAALPTALALRRLAARPGPFAIGLLAAATALSWTEGLTMGATPVDRFRDFYGITGVFDRGGMRYLEHGSTLHGRQYTGGPKAATPLGYYHPSTPAAGVLASSAFRFRRIDMIGLGTGALAAYAGGGTSFTIREIDPRGVAMALKDFTYLEGARRRGAALRFVVGDGRVTLRREPPRSIGLLIVDAFNSGSIPVHLLTREAFQEYGRVLEPEGLLLLHVSNRFLDLRPVVYAVAQSLGFHACEKSNERGWPPDADPTSWMAVSPSPLPIEVLRTRLAWLSPEPGAKRPPPWTDDSSNLLGALAWRGWGGGGAETPVPRGDPIRRDGGT